VAKKRTTPAGLIRFDGAQVVRPADAQDVEPKWNKLFPLGTFHRSDFPGGELVFDRAFLQSMVDNWVKGGRKAKPIDSLHRGDSGEDGLPASEKSARGWIEDLKLEGDGLYGLVRWNAKGLAFILGDEYRYLSPSFHPDWVDTHSGERQGPTLFGAGLLNNPFLEELPRVAASVSGDEPKEHTVNKKMICSYLGMPEDTADDAVMECIKQLASSKKLSDEKESALKLSATKDAEALKLAQADNVKLSTRIEKLETESKEAAERALKVETVALCDKLQGEGRIIAAQKSDVEEDVKTYGLSKATERWSKQAVVVPLGERGIAGKGDGDVTPESAFKSLQAKADELVKAGTPRAAALELAQQQNPKLALAASKLASPMPGMATA
jgi:phage I-like protein